MKTYNFDQTINRHGTNSEKWDRYQEDIMPLWVADMDFPAPPEVLAALQARLDHPVFGYSSSDAELEEVVCTWVERRHGWHITPEQVITLPGVVTGINWVARSFGKADRGYLIQTPVYPPFFYAAKNAQLKLIEAPLVQSNGRYEIDFEEFEQRIITGNAGIFVLCNPHNPVGRVFTRAELERLGEICLRHQVLICSDEIHCDLIYSGQKHIPIASLSKDLEANTITLMAASKTFNIPGLHFSFAIVPNADLRKKMELAGAGLVGHPEIFANVAAKAAFTKCDGWLKDLLVYLKGNRDYLVGFLKKHIPEIRCTAPEGTYLAWLDCRGLDSQSDPYTFFLEKARVALNDGKSFGDNGRGFVRLNFGCPRTTLTAALVRMLQAIEQTK
jgi:cystathionine beta-lyase